MRPARCPRAGVGATATRPRASNVARRLPPPATHQLLIRPIVRVGAPAARAIARAVSPSRQCDSPAEVSRAWAGAQRPRAAFVPAGAAVLFARMLALAPRAASPSPAPRAGGGAPLGGARGRRVGVTHPG